MAAADLMRALLLSLVRSFDRRHDRRMLNTTDTRPPYRPPSVSTGPEGSRTAGMVLVSVDGMTVLHLLPEEAERVAREMLEASTRSRAQARTDHFWRPSGMAPSTAPRVRLPGTS